MNQNEQSAAAQHSQNEADWCRYATPLSSYDDLHRYKDKVVASCDAPLADATTTGAYALDWVSPSPSFRHAPLSGDYSAARLTQSDFVQSAGALEGMLYHMTAQVWDNTAKPRHPRPFVAKLELVEGQARVFKLFGDKDTKWERHKATKTSVYVNAMSERVWRENWQEWQNPSAYKFVREYAKDLDGTVRFGYLMDRPKQGKPLPYFISWNSVIFHKQEDAMRLYIFWKEKFWAFNLIAGKFTTKTQNGRACDWIGYWNQKVEAKAQINEAIDIRNELAALAA